MVFDLEIVSALEIKVIVVHVGSYLKEAGAEKSEKEGPEIENMSDLEGDYSSKGNRDKGGL